jgi:hypothetical protein
MSLRRILAITLIFCLASAGWAFLGTVTSFRADNAYYSLGSQVGQLWGRPLVQQAPVFNVQMPGSRAVRWVMPAENEIQVELLPDERKKGLIWYPTYICRFQGRYILTNEEAVLQKVRLHFDFPEPGATYDNFSATIDGRSLGMAVDPQNGIDHLLELAPGQSREFYLRYETRGMDYWRYQPDPHTGRVRNLNLEVVAGFTNPDYTSGSLSPMAVEPLDNGLRLTWKAADLITRADMGVIMPQKINPGPLAARITYFAPVCLLFFFVLVTAMGLVYKIPIHPMHYLFVAAGFFAFHLLLAYLVDHIPIHMAFVISAAVTVGLVTSYLQTALKKQLPWKVAVAGQVFYLLLFSYSFFLKGATGLTVAVGSVATLAVLMKVTAGIQWEDVFVRRRAARRAVPETGRS